MICYLCSYPEFFVRKGVVRDNPSLDVYECSNCGLVSLSSKEHIRDDHYCESGMHGEILPSMESWLQDTAPDDHRRFEMLKPSITNKKILDFGCGAAGFLCKAKMVAVDASGVEPERRVREYWVGKIKLYGSLEEAEKGYNVITAFHVIEHLPDPRSILRELSSRLSKGGRLIIEVPNSEDALLTLYDCDAFQRFSYWSQHLFLFNTNTIKILAKQAGLKIIAIHQYQRYPLSNHLHWLSRGRPGGHEEWRFLDSQILGVAYSNALASIGRCDTLIAYLEPGA